MEFKRFACDKNTNITQTNTNTALAKLEYFFLHNFVTGYINRDMFYGKSYH